MTTNGIEIVRRNGELIGGFWTDSIRNPISCIAILQCSKDRLSALITISNADDFSAKFCDSGLRGLERVSKRDSVMNHWLI